MTIREIELAISAHIEAFERFAKSPNGQGAGLRALVETEFAARRVLVNGRGENTSAEIRRVTYIAGFLIASRVLENNRLHGEDYGVQH